MKGAPSAAGAAAVVGSGWHPPPRAKPAAWQLCSHGIDVVVPAAVSPRRLHVGPPCRAVSAVIGAVTSAVTAVFGAVVSVIRVVTPACVAAGAVPAVTAVTFPAPCLP